MGLRVPAITIGELIKVGLPAVAIRCLHPLCQGEAVVRLASFPAEMHDIDQHHVDWACVHCGRGRVVIEQPAGRHTRYRPMTLDEMRLAAQGGAEGSVPCWPRQVIIEDGAVVVSRGAGPSYRRRF